MNTTVEHLWHSPVGLVERGTGFRHLANAHSSLYRRGSEEARSLDAMLLAAPR